MMNDYSIITSIDNTQLIEVYEYYDRPLFFACQNQVGDIYLTLLIDDDEEAGTENWYYLRVSAERFEQIRNGIIDIHSAFKRAELGFIRSVVKDIASGNIISIENLVAADLNDDCLHYPGEYLNVPVQTLLP